MSPPIIRNRLFATSLLVLLAPICGCGSSDEAATVSSNYSSTSPATARTTAPPPPPSLAPSITGTSRSQPNAAHESSSHGQASDEDEDRFDDDDQDDDDQNVSGPEQANPSPGSNEPDAQVGASLGSNVATWLNAAKEHFKGARKRDDDASVDGEFSWLVEILPFLGHQDIYDKFEFDKRWSKRVNVEQAVQIIPAFQNPLDKRRRWDGYPFQGMGLTHFVGVSGVERRRLDVAANFPRSHQDAGVFGYDEIMHRDQITDGQSQTIAIIGSGELAGPWVLAGGATVRGARQPNYFDELTGFGSRGTKSKGAAALTADGAAHFISADVDPRVFEALCTAHGAESLPNLEAALQAAQPVPVDKRLRFQHTELSD